MFITIAVQCHNFQRRLNWMMSSLYQQTKNDNIVIDVAYHKNDGDPKMEDLFSYFDDKINIKKSYWDEYEKFMLRGITRTKQLEECETEWLLFADTDMVYHPEYFERLEKELNENHQNATYMLSAGRMSTKCDEENLPLTYDLVNSKQYPSDIVNAYKNARFLPQKRMINVGAGFFQLINVKNCPHENYYVKEDNCKDKKWTEGGQKARSDVQFRRRISKNNERVNLKKWFSRNQVHLNHHRDNWYGKHLEEQR